jgi:hypothetical protein
MLIQTLKYKCDEVLEIYSRVKNTTYYNYIQIESNTYELPRFLLPRLIENDFSQKLNVVFEEIKCAYQDVVLYENDQWICQEYRELAEEYIDVNKHKDNDEIIVKIVLGYQFELV